MKIYLIKKREKMYTNIKLKLTKTGEKLSKANKDELEKYFIKKLTPDNYKKLNYNELLGLSINPLLTEEQIETIIELMKQEKIRDRKKIKIAKQIVDNLSLHSNLKNPKLIEFLVLNIDVLGIPIILYNPNVTEEHLLKYFKKRIIYNNSYDISRFNDLMQVNNITPSLVLKWYEILKKYANWEFTDYTWESVVDTFLKYEDCPSEILQDMLESIIISDKNEHFIIDYIKKILDHKNAFMKLNMIAYEKTKLTEFLPKELKDAFFIS